MNKQTIFILSGILSLFLTNCTAEPLHVKLVLPQDTEKVWAALTSRVPLPKGIILSRGSRSAEECSIVLSSTFSSAGKEYTIQSAKNFTAYSSVISRQWYAPQTALWSLDSGKKTALVPLNHIRLPMKALPINGSYPDSAAYPGIKITTVTLLLPKDAKNIPRILREQLINWMHRISHNPIGRVEKKPDIAWIGGVGDLMLQRGVETILLGSKNGIHTIFTDTLPILREEDLLLGNLEGSITRRNRKTPKSYNFKFNPAVLPLLHKAGFDYLSQTNNHIYDYGEEGFIDSLNYLKNSSIATSGAGMTIEEAQAYWETSIKGQTIRVLSIGAYPKENNGFDGKTQASVTSIRPGILFAGPLADEAVRRMASPDTFDIIFIHGGKEWHSTPTKQQKALYRSYIDMGADLILGSHPHVLQGIEARNGKLIVYSLGNFIFPGMGGMRYGENSIILSLGIVNGEIKYVLPIPVKINNKTLQLDKRASSLKRYLKLIKEQN